MTHIKGLFFSSFFKNRGLSDNTAFPLRVSESCQLHMGAEPITKPTINIPD